MRYRLITSAALLALAACDPGPPVLGPPVPVTTTVPDSPTTTVTEPVQVEPEPEPEAPAEAVAPPAEPVPVTEPERVHRTTTTIYEPPAPQARTTRGEAVGTGGWAIPEYIVMCESGGDWNAANRSGAAGPYQLMPEHFGGESALSQSPAAQHAKAAELWAGGAGASHWQACL